jgi:hypothetical protein
MAFLQGVLFPRPDYYLSKDELRQGIARLKAAARAPDFRTRDPLDKEAHARLLAEMERALAAAPDDTELVRVAGSPGWEQDRPDRIAMILGGIIALLIVVGMLMVLL